MRLTLRLSSALLAVVLLVFTLQAWWRLGHDLSTFEDDMRRDHRAIGRSLGNAIAEVWGTQGEASALHLLQQANEREADILIEWVWLGQAADATGPMPGGDRAWHLADREISGRLHSYVPVAIPNARPGAIHVAESLAEERAFIASTILRTVVVTLVLALLAGITASVVGAWFVGRPVRALIDKARRVGAGELAEPVVLRSDDEFGILAREMNTMSEGLAEARRRLDEETQSRIEAVEQVRQADRLMTVGRMAAAIAHELGTPLNIVSMRAQMMADAEVDPAEMRDQARSIGEHADQMARIIQQLLNFARPRTCERAPTDLRSVVEQTLALLEPVAVKQRATLAFTRPDAPVICAVDAAQLQQVLTNLVVNGLQSMRRPGTVRLRLGEERRPPAGRPASAAVPFVWIAVADEGDGINRADLPRIFEPFFSTKPAGAGLGLSVIQGIVRDHGGFIEVASSAGTGCTFCVWLPVEAPAASTTDERGLAHAG